MHELPDRRFIDGFGGRDQVDPSVLQLSGDDGVVEPVAGHSTEFVEDDIVDVMVGTDAFEHLLEGNALGHFPSGLSRLDVLVDDRYPH